MKAFKVAYIPRHSFIIFMEADRVVLPGERVVNDLAIGHQDHMLVALPGKIVFLSSTQVQINSINKVSHLNCDLPQ